MLLGQTLFPLHLALCESQTPGAEWREGGSIVLLFLGPRCRSLRQVVGEPRELYRTEGRKTVKAREILCDCYETDSLGMSEACIHKVSRMWLPKHELNKTGNNSHVKEDGGKHTRFNQSHFNSSEMPTTYWLTPFLTGLWMGFKNPTPSSLSFQP